MTRQSQQNLLLRFSSPSFLFLALIFFLRKRLVGCLRVCAEVVAFKTHEVSSEFLSSGSLGRRGRPFALVESFQLHFGFPPSALPFSLPLRFLFLVGHPLTLPVLYHRPQVFFPFIPLIVASFELRRQRWLCYCGLASSRHSLWTLARLRLLLFLFEYTDSVAGELHGSKEPLLWPRCYLWYPNEFRPDYSSAVKSVYFCFSLARVSRAPRLPISSTQQLESPLF